MPAIKQETGSTGTQTAALVMGGGPPAPVGTNETYEYDGSSWTAGGDTTTTGMLWGACGTQTAALLFGGRGPGSPGELATTQNYNGTAWTNNPASLGTARYQLGSCGTATTALGMGGFGGPTNRRVDTEEFSTTVTLKTVTDS